MLIKWLTWLQSRQILPHKNLKENFPQTHLLTNKLEQCPLNEKYNNIKDKPNETDNKTAVNISL